MTFCYNYISVPWSAIIRVASPAVDGNKYRDPVPNNVQKVRDLGTVSPKWDVSIKPLLTRLKEICRRRNRKRKIVRTRMSAMRQCLSIYDRKPALTKSEKTGCSIQ